MISNFYIPGRPTSPEPQDLVMLASSIHHRDVNRVGITTTLDGSWALLVVVKEGIIVPIHEIEQSL